MAECLRLGRLRKIWLGSGNLIMFPLPQTSFPNPTGSTVRRLRTGTRSPEVQPYDQLGLSWRGLLIRRTPVNHEARSRHQGGRRLALVERSDQVSRPPPVVDTRG